eukprot:gene3307-biopygen20198
MAGMAGTIPPPRSPLTASRRRRGPRHRRCRRPRSPRRRRRRIRWCRWSLRRGPFGARPAAGSADPMVSGGDTERGFGDAGQPAGQPGGGKCADTGAGVARMSGPGVARAYPLRARPGRARCRFSTHTRVPSQPRDGARRPPPLPALSAPRDRRGNRTSRATPAPRPRHLKAGIWLTARGLAGRWAVAVEDPVCGLHGPGGAEPDRDFVRGEALACCQSHRQRQSFMARGGAQGSGRFKEHKQRGTSKPGNLCSQVGRGIREFRFTRAKQEFVEGPRRSVHSRCWLGYGQRGKPRCLQRCVAAAQGRARSAAAAKMWVCCCLPMLFYRAPRMRGNSVNMLHLRGFFQEQCSNAWWAAPGLDCHCLHRPPGMPHCNDSLSACSVDRVGGRHGSAPPNTRGRGRWWSHCEQRHMLFRTKAHQAQWVFALGENETHWGRTNRTGGGGQFALGENKFEGTCTVRQPLTAAIPTCPRAHALAAQMMCIRGRATGWWAL